jgi:prepilin-type N-terminal cleavage/methylation domain-containing protein
MTKRQPDKGYTLIELLLVIVVLAILATVVVASVGGFTAEAENSACAADSHTLANAVEAYFAQRGTDTILEVGTTADRYELYLADQEFLRSPSTLYNLNAAGDLVQAPGSTCTP